MSPNRRSNDESSKEVTDMNHYITRAVLGLVSTIPAQIVNYSAVAILIYVFHFQTFYVLSAVLLGDLVGFGFNNAIMGYQIKFLKHFQAYRALYEAQAKPGIPSLSIQSRRVAHYVLEGIWIWSLLLWGYLSIAINLYPQYQFTGISFYLNWPPQDVLALITFPLAFTGYIAWRLTDDKR